MNTQNIKTAASESSERWVKNTSLRTDGFVRNIRSFNSFDLNCADVVLTRMAGKAIRLSGLHHEIYEARLMSMAMHYLARLPMKDRPVFIQGSAWKTENILR